MPGRLDDELNKEGARPLNIGYSDEGFGPNDHPLPSTTLDDHWPGNADPQGPLDPPDCLD